VEAMPEVSNVMRVAVIQFPGSNCDMDCQAALLSFAGVSAEIVWHKETSLKGYDAVVLPGGFSYGDYLRCGSIARFSPIMGAVRLAASTGVLVLGICNGFQILCEAGLLPGTLTRNNGLLFRCEHLSLLVENTDTPFTSSLHKGEVLGLPIAHGEGSYFADQETLRVLNANRQVLLRYCEPEGKVSQASNPNGSLENIAGICSHGRNVFGLMPHPERVCDPLIGGVDGRGIFKSMIDWTVEHPSKS
jgi:phosphoribosylformylglycinamidine synthase